MINKLSKPAVIEVISPVHIGTGKTITHWLDFCIHGNKVKIFDRNKLDEKVPFDDLLMCYEDGSLKRLFDTPWISSTPDNSIPQWKRELLEAQGKIEEETAPSVQLKFTDDLFEQENLLKRSFPNSESHDISDIQLHIANRNKAYIPGTSLKGAIRTAIWWWLLKNDSQLLKKAERRTQRTGKKYADNKMEKMVMGRDPFHDILRALQITDSTTAQKMEVAESLIADVGRNNQIGWKSLSRRRIHNQPQPASSVFVQAIPIGEQLTTNIRIDKLLLDSPANLGFNYHQKDALKNLTKSCNAYAKSLIEHEIDFFTKYKGAKKIEKFYRNLLNDLNSFDENTCLIQVGWGTGWYNKTVTDNFSIKKQNELRQAYNLGKRHVPIFPKTRKVIFEDKTPKYPLGWIKLVF